MALALVAAYPILTGVMWTLTSLVFYRRNERAPLPGGAGDQPFVSIVVAAYREEAVIDSTLDALLALYYPHYEPRAVVAMQVPETLGGLWQQRKRWSKGLAQVLRRHADLFLDWRTRRLWPVFIEAIGSVLWAYLAVGMICVWALSYSLGLEPLGANPVANFWGMVIATVALVQLGVGVWLDGRYNRSVARFYLWAPLYPLFYWMLMLIVTVTATPAALLGRKQATSRWRTARVGLDDEESVEVERRRAA